MLRIIVITLLLGVIFIGKAQSTNQWVIKKRLPYKGFTVYVDQLNNIYTLTKGEIKKIDNQGELYTCYSNKLIGDDIQLDVSNPMKVLVFSPAQMRLIFLDSRLGELREEVNLYREGYEQISLAATSHSNGFWLYDPINFKMVRYDQRFKKEHESPNLAQLLRLQFYPTDLVEVDNRVYLTDPRHGVFVFDVYGNYIKRIPIKDIKVLKVTNNRMFFVREGMLYGFNLYDSSEESVLIPFKMDKPFDINRNLICISEAEEIIILKPKQ